MKKSYFSLLVMLCLSTNYSQAQETETPVSNIQNIPSKYYSSIQKKFSSIDENLRKKSIKYLEKLQRQEIKMERKLSKIDSLSAHNLFVSSQQQYADLTKKMNTDSAASTGKVVGEYLPYLDSIKGSLSFLQQGKTASTLLKEGNVSKISSALTEVNQFQNKLQDAEAIKQFIKERKQQITDALSRYTSLPNGIKNVFASYKKESYYYSAQVKEYKDLLNDPDKMEMKALSLLNQLPAFRAFMKKNSALAGLFNIPSNYGSAQALAGLQTRDQVQQLITNQLGGGPNVGQLFGQRVQSAQQQLNQFKDKLSKLGGGSGDIEMPDFKPNEQKTKTFFQRLEYGSNLQTTRGSFSFPTTTDIGLSVAYKLNSKNSVGIGASYKGGWGKDIQHINITAEGMGLRSFFEFKLKKTFYATGGLEYNYQQPFHSTQQLEKLDAWQQSGLIGISKVIDVKSKLFKKTKLQLLWDFLSYQQAIRTQPLKFRVGYNF